MVMDGASLPGGLVDTAIAKHFQLFMAVAK